MTRLRSLISGALAGGAAGLLALAAPAMATTHTLNLTGDLATASTSSFISGGYNFSILQLELAGTSPFVIDSGDVIDFSIGFTGFMFGVPPIDVLLVPGSVATGAQFVGINFIGAEDPTFDVSNAGSLSLVGAAGDLDGLDNPISANCGNCLSVIFGRGGPAYGSFSFAGLAGSSTFSVVEPFEIERVELSYQVQTSLVAGPPGAIPEPASWMMLMVGFGLVGALARRPRVRRVTA